ncbi:magnesium/cobalt transporter CorA [bacterium]|nr:magnesium/cobalt transporter CorA [bacterium]
MVSRLIQKISRTKNTVPGDLVLVGEQKEWSAVIRVMEYDENEVLEKEITSIEECERFYGTQRVTWLSLEGLHDLKAVEQAGACFHIDPLVLEDIVNTGQRPKMEDFDTHLFVVLKALRFSHDSGEVVTDQVAVVFTASEVITFQEERGGLFEHLRERIRRGKGKLRRLGTDYLAYAIIDSVVDNYFGVLEEIGERIEFLEDELVSDPDEYTLHEIYRLKREVIFLRKTVWPLRELVASLCRRDSDLIRESTIPFLRDTYDHTVQVIETIETFRDVLSGMLDMYMSSLSNKMNAVMKVLTVIATLFMPLTFIAGLYGMNFKHMPELEWPWGYAFALLLMAAVTVVMLVYFRRKDWL